MIVFEKQILLTVMLTIVDVGSSLTIVNKGLSLTIVNKIQSLTNVFKKNFLIFNNDRIEDVSQTLMKMHK